MEVQAVREAEKNQMISTYQKAKQRMKELKRTYVMDRSLECEELEALIFTILELESDLLL